MKVGLLGTGVVGRTVGTKLIELGHEVTMGSREAGNERAVEWADAAGDAAAEGSFADAARVSDLIINATSGSASLAALSTIEAADLDGKILIDAANPFDASAGMPPTLSVSNDDSLGEQIQASFPASKVVKAMNTMSCLVMVEPARVPGDHVTPIAGNDDEAKLVVSELIESFGWPRERVIDYGDITAARGLEMYMAFWIRLFMKFGDGDFNIALQRAAPVG